MRQLLLPSSFPPGPKHSLLSLPLLIPGTNAAQPPTRKTKLTHTHTPCFPRGEWGKGSCSFNLGFRKYGKTKLQCFPRLTLALKEVFFWNVFYVCIFSDIPSFGVLYVPISCNAPAKKVVCGGRSAAPFLLRERRGKRWQHLSLPLSLSSLPWAAIGRREEDQKLPN